MGEDNEPKQWAAAKFCIECWDSLNMNLVESWNMWVLELRQMSIPILITGHIIKLRTKMDRRKVGVLTWKNGKAGSRKGLMTFMRMGSSVNM